MATYPPQQGPPRDSPPPVPSHHSGTWHQFPSTCQLDSYPAADLTSSYDSRASSFSIPSEMDASTAPTQPEPTFPEQTKESAQPKSAHPHQTQEQVQLEQTGPNHTQPAPSVRRSRIPHSRSTATMNRYFIPSSSTVRNTASQTHYRQRQFPSSETWTSSSGDLALMSDTDELVDREEYIKEYNRLAKKVSLSSGLCESMRRPNITGT